MSKINLYSPKNRLKNKITSFFAFNKRKINHRRQNFHGEKKYSFTKFLKQLGYILFILSGLFAILFLIYGNYFRLKNINIVSLNTE